MSLSHDAEPHKPQYYPPGAPDAPTDAAANDHEAPEPEGIELVAYTLHALVDRLVLISDHMQAIEDDLLDVLHRQEVIAGHFSAVKDHIEREALP